jgi:hypothetical protein
MHTLVFNILLYKHLTDIKQDVIIEIEQNFTCCPFLAEKELLGWHTHFTWIERGVPAAFSVIYITALVLHFVQKS